MYIFFLSNQTMRLERKKEILCVSLKVINYWSLQDWDTFKLAWKCNEKIFRPPSLEFSNHS